MDLSVSIRIPLRVSICIPGRGNFAGESLTGHVSKRCAGAADGAGKVP